MKKIIIDFIKKYKKTSIIFCVFLLYICFLIVKLFEPSVEYLDYYNQKLELENNVIIVNTFDSSFEVCYSGITKIVRDWKEKILIDFPHTKNLYIKGCAIDIKYINKSTIEFPICYVWWGWSWECSLAFMQYNINTKKWLFMWTDDYYAWADEIPLYYRVLNIFHSFKYLFSYKKDDWDIDFRFLKWFILGETFNDTFQKVHFDSSFYKFINYFKENYTLDNFEEFDEIYKSKDYLLSDSEKEVLLNTIYYYTNNSINWWDIYEYFDKKIISFYDIKLDKELKKYVAKLQYIQSMDFYEFKWKKYNESIWFDWEIKKDFEEITYWLRK